MISPLPTCSMCGSELIGRSLNICPICKKFDPPQDRTPTAEEMLESYHDMSARPCSGPRFQRAREAITRVLRRIAYAIMALVFGALSAYLAYTFATKGLSGQITHLSSRSGGAGRAVAPWVGATVTLVESLMAAGMAGYLLISAIRGQDPLQTKEERRAERAIRHERAVRLNICPRCGYDMRGLPIETRCPECGAQRYREFVPPAALDQ